MKTDEVKRFFQDNIYGQWRDGEKVTYSISDIQSGTEIAVDIPWVRVPDDYCKLARKNLCVRVATGEKEISFSVSVYLPEVPAPQEGFPYIVAFHPIEPLATALKKGFVLVVFTDYCLNIASDNNKRKGLFYDLYPYGRESEQQTGVLMAWAWGASKVLDAMYSGAAGELGLNAEDSIITGVSRWGKAAALCGAFEARFKMTAPSCSGAGGLALFNYKSEGKTYDFSAKGGKALYTYGQNEPIGALQSVDEQGWFNGHFLDYKSEADIEIGQEELINLCANENRFYFMIASCEGEDWVNGPAMWECAKKASVYYKERGLENHLTANIHLQGHADIDEDMEKLTDYFKSMTKGQQLNSDLKKLTDFTRSEFKESL